MIAGCLKLVGICLDSVVSDMTIQNNIMLLITNGVYCERLHGNRGSGDLTESRQ